MEKNNQRPAGFQRFIVQLDKLSVLLSAASQSATPALTLFQSPARQYAFYLQALARIYRKIHDKTPFNTLRKEFKLLEDQMGRIDFFHAFYEEFSKQDGFPAPLLEYFKSHRDQELIALQQLLDDRKWIDTDRGRVAQIIKELESMSWLEALTDRTAVANFLNEELNDFRKDYKKEKFDFSLIEQGVHEFRRQLRWFSIYAQALDGLIQLQDNPGRATVLAKYLTPDILNSPFNKMPPAKNDLPPIYVAAPDFYAVSWVINEIGILKDEGLRIHALTEAIVETGIKGKSDAEAYAISLSGGNSQNIKDISKRAREITDELMKKEAIIYEL